MRTTTALLALTLVAAAAAAPWGGSGAHQCSRECSIAAPKFSYLNGKTYTYNYNGKADVSLQGMEGAAVATEFVCKVALTWLTPCDLAISMNVKRVDGNARSIASREDIALLEKYPLVVAINDGKIQHVCSHPDDEPWSANIKRGIASFIQNSLPSLTNIGAPQNLTETDVIGRCPTKYQVEGEGSRVVVTKEKNHKHCHQRYYTPSETHQPWLKAPIPHQESWTKCTQEINNGIINTVRCEGMDLAKPMIGSYKYAQAKLDASMTYKSISDTQPATIATLSQVELKPASVVHDYHWSKKNQTMVPEIEQKLNEICQSTKEMVQNKTASRMAEVISLMQRVPHQTLPQILEKIRSKQICPDNPKLESLFLDSIAFTQEAGSVKIMVDEIVSGRASWARTAIYTTALYLVPRPCIHAVTALQPLFESERPPAMAKLAAASMVHTYCRLNPHCYDEAPVRNVVQALSNKLQSQCSSSYQNPQPALTTLKALANIGVVTPEVASSVFTCMEAETTNINVRVAAAQAFRLAKCHQQTTRQLTNYAVNPVKDTEVRVASYLAAVRCATQEDLEKIVAIVSTQPNTQVRGFILSHLSNLQQSDAPEKQQLRYNLTSIIIPTDFEADMRKYSRNIDLSYWAPSLGLGAGVESNIIYAPGSFIPRSLDFNLTAAMDGIPLNIGELGARIQGLEPIIAQTFGPDGYFFKSSYEKIFQDAVAFIQKNWRKIQQEFDNFRQRRSVDYSVITSFLHHIYGDTPAQAQADAFVRFMGQELSFISLAGDLKQFDSEAFIQRVLEKLRQIIPNPENINIDTARMVQFSQDYYFTNILGSSVKLTMNTTAVAGLKVKANLPSILSGWPRGQNLLQIYPSISVQTDGFFGYDAVLLRLGLKTNNTISSASGASVKVSANSDSEMEVEMDIPDKMDLINIKSDTYLMTKHRSGSDIKFYPSSMSDVRTRAKSCISSLESVLDIKLCYDINVPDVFRSNSLPLVSHPAVVRLHLEKSQAQMKGYKMSLSRKEEGSNQILAGKISTKSSSPKETQVQAEYKKEQDKYTGALKVQSSSINGKVEGQVINQDSHKAIQAYTEFKSSETQMAKGIKVDLKRSSVGNGQQYDLQVFLSKSQQFSPESSIFEAKYKKINRNPMVDLEISALTKNVLREYILIDYQSEGEFEYMTNYHVPVPMKLRKLEFQGGLSEWKVTSFLRNSGESDQRAEYLSSFKVINRDQDLLSAEATMAIQGQLGRDFVATTSASGKAGRKEYKVSNKVEIGHSKKALALQIIRSSDNTKILDLQTSVQQAQPVSLQFQIESQLVAEGIKFVVMATEQEQEQYGVQIALTRGSRSLILIQGPVTVAISPYATKLRTDLTINSQRRLVTTLDYQDNKQALSIHLEQQQQPIFVVEWDIKPRSSQGAMASGKMMVPRWVDGKMDIIMSETVFHASTNTLMWPNTEIARRIKAFTDINLDSQQLQADLSWDADHDTSKKVTVQGQVVRYTSNPPQAQVQSSVVWKGQNYRVNMDLQPQSLLTQYEGQGSFMVEVMTPTQQTHTVNTQVNLQQHPNNIMIDSSINYKSPESTQYKLTSKMNWEKVTGPYGFKLDSHLGYTSPQGQEKYFALQASHQTSSQERVIQFKTTVKTPSLSQPLVTEFQVNNQDYSYNIKLQKEASQAAVFKWEMEIFPQGGVKTFDTAIDVRAIRDVLQEILKITGSESANIMMYERQRGTFRSRYHSPEDRSHAIMIETPSCIMETQAKYSPSEISLEVYPNRHQSEAKYKVAAKSSHSFFGTRYEGHISHPSLHKDMSVLVEYSTSGDSKEGSFELDIFPDTTDKVTGTLRSTLIANNTIRVELDMQSRVLQVNPRVSVEGSWGPHTKAFDFMFHKTPASPASLKMAAKYDQITTREATLAVRLATVEGRVMDFSGVIKSEKVPNCNGLKIDAKVWTSVIGNFDVHSQVCKLGSIKLITKRPQANKIYITKFGIQLPYTAEISLFEADKFGFNRRPISLIGTELVSPTSLEFKLGGDTEETQRVKEFVVEDFKRVARAVGFWAEEVYQQLQQQAQQKGTSFPNPELLKVLKQIYEESSHIYSEVMSEVINPSWQVISDFIQGPIGSSIKSFVYQSMQNISSAKHNLTTYIKEIIKMWTQEFSGIIDTIIEGVKEGAQWLQTGQEPQLLRDLIHQLQESFVVELAKLREMLEVIQSRYPQQYSAALQVMQKVNVAFRKDLDEGRQYLLNYPVTNTIINDVIRTVSNEDELLHLMAKPIASQLMKIFALVDNDDYITVVAVPLYRPLYSLSQVVQKLVEVPHKMAVGTITFTPVSDTYYKWLPRQLLPPYNRTALVVGDTELLTFDGTILRAPRSPCKVLLTSIPGAAQIFMSHPQLHSPPELTFKAGQVTASISPDFSVKLNGQPVNGQRTESPVNVQVTSHNVTVESPLLGLTVLKEERVVMVNVSGWAFNHTRGLLGTYDAEVANDWLTSSGRNASSLQELVRSYQENPSCPTPPINPVMPDRVPIIKYIKCQFLFYMMKGCHSMVNHLPFINQCYTEQTACHGAIAYQHTCQGQGYIFPLPIPCYAA